MTILDFGCGPKKTPGAIGVDKVAFAGVDVVWDLEKFPYPFKDDSADGAVLSHCIEHFDDPIAVLREVSRIVRAGGRIRILTPHFSSMNVYSDFTHRHAFSLHVFRNISLYNGTVDPKNSYQDYMSQMGANEASPVRLRLASRRLTFWPLHDAVGFVPFRWIGIEWLANRFPILYERFLAFLFPANEIQVELEVLKG